MVDARLKLPVGADRAAGFVVPTRWDPDLLPRQRLIQANVIPAKLTSFPRRRESSGPL